MKETGSVTFTLANGEADLLGGWIPPSEVQQLVIEAGYDPDELIEEIFDWCARRLRSGLANSQNGTIREPTEAARHV
jgi:hypothetical protein